MDFKIKISEIRHPILIQGISLVKDPKDFINKPKWIDKIKTRAKILNVRGDEYIQAQGVGLKIEKTFYIRASRLYKITEEDRILYKDIPYEIVYINDIENLGRWLEIKAKRCK